MSILKKVIPLMCMLLLIQMSGCSTSSVPEKVDTPEVISEYTLSHGVSSLDVIKENLYYVGKPLQLEYTFENGNVDSNIGLLMFIDGDIQPFSVDGDEDPKVMNIIEMKEKRDELQGKIPDKSFFEYQDQFNKKKNNNSANKAIFSIPIDFTKETRTTYKRHDKAELGFDVRLFLTKNNAPCFPMRK